MKRLITSFFLLLLNFGVFCQSDAFTFNESFSNTAMSEVFAILKEKYQIKVAYDYASVKDIKVDKTIESTNLESALNILFDNTDLEFQLLKDNRVLVRKVQNLSLSDTTIPLHQFTFKGTITDRQSKRPLAYATIFCAATNEGCSADESGQFSLAVHSLKSEGTITIQYLGYIPKVLTWKKGEKLTNLNIELQAKALDFSEVTILDKLPTISVNQEDGSMIMRANTLDNLPSFIGGNDIFRSLQLLPGISATDDLSSAIKIRGSSGDENMIILDGITLYKVDHYFGIFSAINSNIINQVKVYKNAFPVEYGGRTAGVIDLMSHNIEAPKISGGLQLDLLTSNAYLTIPINENMGLLFGGRTTNKNVANEDLFELIRQNNSRERPKKDSPIKNENPNFKFYDINAKWFWKIKERSTLSAHFFRGYDDFEYSYERQLATTNKVRGKVSNTEFFNESADWNNQGASLQWNQQWQPNLKTDVNLAYSSYTDNQLINSSLVRTFEKRPPQPDPGMPRPPKVSEVDTTFQLSNKAFNSIKGIELNTKNEWAINQSQKLTFGYHLVHNEVGFDINVDNKQAISNQVSGEQHSIYGQYDIKTKKDFNFGLGLRNTYYSVTQKNYLSPRLNLSYKVNENFKLKASWSKYYQFLRQNYREDRFGQTYEFWILSNGDQRQFPVATSTQWMAGFNFFKSGFELDVEAYYKDMDGVTEFALQQNGFSEDGVTPPSEGTFALFNGTGVSKGIDVLLKKNAGNYTGWLTYTLSKVTHSFNQIDNGNPFPSQDDRRHQLKLINQYRYKKFDFSATYIHSTGRPYTDLSNLNVLQDRTELSAEERIAYLEDYNRIDIGASYRFCWGNNKGRIGLSIFNVFDYNNVKYRQYYYSIPNQENDLRAGLNVRQNDVIGTELKMLPRTPNISFSLEF